MGEEKINKMHEEFANRVRGEKNSHSAKATRDKLDTVSETKRMLDGGAGIKEISVVRDLKIGTILDHIEQIKRKTRVIIFTICKVV